MTVIEDPLYGQIFFSEQIGRWIQPFLESVAFQRLRDIHQLGLYGFSLLPPSYSRYQHSLGTCYIASQIMHVLSDSIISACGVDFYETCLHYAVVAALLHDIGHGPFSHAFEYLFWDRKKRRILITHEKWGHLFLQEYERTLWPVYQDPSSPCSLLKTDMEHISAMIHGTLKDPGFYFLKQIISSTFDADRLDYVLRDAHFYGIPHGLERDALIANFKWNTSTRESSRKNYLTVRDVSLIRPFHTLRKYLFKTHYLSVKKMRLEYAFADIMNKMMQLPYAHLCDYFTPPVASFLSHLWAYKCSRYTQAYFLQHNFYYYKNLTEKDFLYFLTQHPEMCQAVQNIANTFSA